MLRLIKWKVRKPFERSIFKDYVGDMSVIREAINKIIDSTNAVIYEVNEQAETIDKLTKRIVELEKSIKPEDKIIGKDETIFIMSSKYGPNTFECDKCGTLNNMHNAVCCNCKRTVISVTRED